MIKLNGVIIEQNHFPDGSLLIKSSNECSYSVIEWKYENDSELFTVYCLKRKIDETITDATVDLKMHYIPHARQDRVKRRDDVFTLKYFSEIINSLKFRNVIVLDPHSPVSEALINNLKIVNVDSKINTVLNIINDDNVVIYYPDNGAYKKYSDIIKHPSCYGVKNRDWDTGKILGLDIITNGIDINGKKILMVDDIISYGGSMYYGAKALKNLNCEDIYIYASHVENSILEGDLINSGLFNKIYTTDSLFSKQHEMIEILN